MTIGDIASKLWNNVGKPAAVLTVIAGVAGSILYKIYWGKHDVSEEYVGFPKNFEPKSVQIESPHYGTVQNDITYVQMLPDEAYKIYNINDSTIAFEGNFKYKIRSGSACNEGYGEDIRQGRVEGIDKK
ncbi:TPA: hypothetical protein HA235_07695 [Candidatus Woesearchaeota archaeon]|nr:hypothetical protein [Candidatus Woesearchaeota archaeon]HIH32562.1 hypothetical protein [Candidatus Woesearchaeota archaeon]HIH54895.1 hypothetical protein [Candidatus Woesearchaeota archaeon]HIJ01746.1 hypothetical protein [Candidatus Woesearchaeota archaeon]HIJ13940.1 hypothetical protein [Candidatus Woesearchaeota archaeon]